MARTKQTARKSSGGPAPRMPLSIKFLSKRSQDKAFDMMKKEHLKGFREKKEEKRPESGEEETEGFKRRFVDGVHGHAPPDDEEKEESNDEEEKKEKELEANDEERDQLDEVIYCVRKYKEEVRKDQCEAIQASGILFWEKIGEMVEERRKALDEAENEMVKKD